MHDQMIAYADCPVQLDAALLRQLYGVDAAPPPDVDA
jgi:hypothetical protein